MLIYEVELRNAGQILDLDIHPCKHLIFGRVEACRSFPHRFPAQWQAKMGVLVIYCSIAAVCHDIIAPDPTKSSSRSRNMSLQAREILAKRLELSSSRSASPFPLILLIGSCYNLSWYHYDQNLRINCWGCAIKGFHRALDCALGLCMQLLPR
jgi:hypothetical protein